jgi:hypothetical protein
VVKAVLLAALAVYLLLAVGLFLTWHSGTKARTTVASLLDSRAGWALPFGIFWKLGRTQGTLGNKWPLWFGALPFIAYRAGEQWTETNGEPSAR